MNTFFQPKRKITISAEGRRKKNHFAIPFALEFCYLFSQKCTPFTENPFQTMYFSFFRNMCHFVFSVACENQWDENHKLHECHAPVQFIEQPSNKNMFMCFVHFVSKLSQMRINHLRIFKENANFLVVCYWRLVNWFSHNIKKRLKKKHW